MAGIAIMLAAVCLNVVCDGITNSTEITDGSPVTSEVEIINDIQTKGDIFGKSFKTTMIQN